MYKLKVVLLQYGWIYSNNILSFLKNLILLVSDFIIQLSTFILFGFSFYNFFFLMNPVEKGFRRMVLKM